MILGYTIYEIIALFFIYGFLGWCIEVIYRGLVEQRFVNSGFLNGPICPIYGVGGAIVVICLTPLEHNIPLLFVGSVILTSALELVTGFALDKLFHARWWDYSNQPLNLGGYICLLFSLAWGAICVALMKLIHPPILGLVKAIPFALGVTIISVLAAVFIADVVVTVVAINHLTSRMRGMEELAAKIRAVSDGIGEKVYDGAKAVAEKGEEIFDSEEAKERLRKYSENAEELKKKYAAIVEEKHLFQHRLIKAFPRMKSHSYNEHLDKLRERYIKRR